MLLRVPNMHLIPIAGTDIRKHADYCAQHCDGVLGKALSNQGLAAALVAGRNGG